MRYKNRLHICEGDVVRIDLEHRNPSVFDAQVLKIRMRYGACNNGRNPMAPLLTVKDVATGEESSLDMSWAVAIVRRNPDKARRQPYNCFREERLAELERDQRNGQPGCYKSMVTTKERGVICGMLPELAARVLAKLSIHLPNPIDPLRLKEEYLRQRRGLVRVERGFVYFVRKQAFEEWVQKNATRICQTSQERHAKETAKIKRYDKDYYRELAMDMEDAFAMPLP